MKAGDDDDALFGSDDGAGFPPDLTVYRSLVPVELQDELALELSNRFTAGTDQLMLFASTSTSLPAFLDSLIAFLRIEGIADDLLDGEGGLQAILNLYRPGQGISPHVDLPHRYGPVILGVSLLSATTMEFILHDDRREARLEPGDVYILRDEARYDWKHGIPARLSDVVIENGVAKSVERGLRMSITLRRMLKGADIVGAEAVSR